jgi:8-oxo-dGTP pyrophosphatase MutT (NUDIX family)
MAATLPVVPRLSAAVMLVRPNADDGGLEVFMVRRHVRSDFAPDVYVFPGGSVASADREAEVTAGVCVPMDALTPDTALGVGVRVAAIRELFEEAGVLLALRDGQPVAIDDALAERLAAWRARLQHDRAIIAELTAAEDIVLATDALSHCAHWITPEAFPKRFDTHFFLAEMPPGQAALHDEIETTNGVWVRPADALAGHEAGDFPLVFATIHQLRDLAAFATPQEAITAWRGHSPATIMPHIIQRDGTEIILLPGEADPT